MIVFKSLSAQRIFWAGLLLAYCGWMFFMSSQPITIPGPSFLLKDKVLHGIAFGLMAWLAWRAFRLWPNIERTFRWAWYYTATYGALDEWHQSYVPGRFSDVGDWIADALGAALCLSILYYRCSPSSIVKNISSKKSILKRIRDMVIE